MTEELPSQPKSTGSAWWKDWGAKLAQFAKNQIDIQRLLGDLKDSNKRLTRQVEDLTAKVEKQAGYIQMIDKLIAVSVENEVRKRLD